MRIALLTAVIFPVTLLAQWQPMNIPVTTDLFSVDALDDQTIAIGTTSNWLRSTNGGANWQVVPLNNASGVQLVGTTFYAMEYQSVNTLFGTGLFFYQGYPFEVHRSTNAGTNWATVFTSNGNGNFSNFEGMAWWGTTHAVVCGDLGRVARTSDGGATWTMTNTGGQDLRDVAWIDATTVIVVGQDRILRSTDSGQNWNTVSTTSGSLYAVSFPTPAIGFAAGAAGNIVRTDDGGLTWAALDVSLPNTIAFRDLWYTSLTECYGLSGDDILYSNDGGLHWSYFIGAAEMRQLHFQNPTNGFAVGFDGHAYRTGGAGAYHPYALFVTNENAACVDSVHTFTSASDPGLDHSWFVNGQLAGTGLTFSTTFTEPSQQDTVQLVVDNGTWTDTLTQVMSVSAPLQISLSATVVADTLCSGQSTQVQVLTSQVGTNYQLRRGTTSIGAAQGGNGGTLTFNTGAITVFDTLNVLAIRSVLGCGTITDTLFFPIALGNPSASLAVTPTAITACRGDVVDMSVPNTEPLVSYQLRRNGIASGPPQQGNGGTLVFPTELLLTNVTYSFFATHANGCANNLLQTVPVTLQVPQLAWGATSVNPEVGAPVDMMNPSDVVGGSFGWNFGANASPANSTAVEPGGIVFNTPGVQVVQLIGITPIGCRDTLEHVLHVIAPPVEQDCGVTQLTCNGGSPGINSVAMMDDGSFYAFHQLEYARDMVALSGAGDTISERLIYTPDAYGHVALMKHDRHGVPQWWVDFWSGDGWTTNSDLLADAAGNSYLAHYHNEFNDSLIIFDASGLRTAYDPVPVGTGSNSTLITSFDPQGRLRWIHRLAGGNTESLNIRFDGNGDILVQTTDALTKITAQGDEVWNRLVYYGYFDLCMRPDGHSIIMERTDMGMREYDSDGVLVNTVPPIVPTPPAIGIGQMASCMAAEDPAGNIYEAHKLSGQIIFDGDTVYGPGHVLEDLPFTSMIVRRGPAGEVVWHREMQVDGSIIMRGMQEHDGRVYLLTDFSVATTCDLVIDGLDTLVTNPNDMWLISYDLDGDNPNATAVYRNDGSGVGGYNVPLNALSFSPNGEHMAFCVPYAAPFVAGTDTAFTFTAFEIPQLPGPRNFGIAYGGLDCLLPGLPANTDVPLAYFATPVDACAGQAVSFADASLYGPSEWSWEFPGGTPATSAEQFPVITYAVPGTYTVTLIATNANGASTPYVTDVLVEVCTGLAERAITSWRTWPIPASDLLHVEGPTNAVGRIIDLQGREVWSGTLPRSGTLDVSTWRGGSYVLMVGEERVRVVVSH